MKSRMLLENFVCEVIDYDLARDGAANHDLAALLHMGKVLVLRNQALSVFEYHQLMLSLGSPQRHVLQNFAVEGFADIIRISNFISPDGEPEGVLDGGAYWHTDMSYQPNIGIATSLLSLREPVCGGHTQFIDMVDALEALRKNQPLCQKLEQACGQPLEAIQVHHRFGNRRALGDPQQPTQRLTRGQQSTLAPVLHHLMQTHPRTGQQSLFAVAGTALRFEGVTPERSLPLLNELEDFVIEHAQFYQHHYRPGDLVIWDNLLTLHRGYGIEPSRNRHNSRLLYRMNVAYTEKGHLI
ncbi:TauD/TfdA family dioxygenase [Mixta sp. Marseille-Q2659]|uniref:TauD/TfdA dioxygenase family protein n=1 Tax=Mixta sp. Marseille-Q2659 TaxID=2736607 RepID=UPI0023B8BF71|nr:TauD/TfdA family dioxygenase [Mixta sp. Marseille-Q2659]